MSMNNDEINTLLEFEKKLEREKQRALMMAAERKFGNFVLLTHTFGLDKEEFTPAEKTYARLEFIKQVDDEFNSMIMSGYSIEFDDSQGASPNTIKEKPEVLIDVVKNKQESVAVSMRAIDPSTMPTHADWVAFFGAILTTATSPTPTKLLSLTTALQTLRGPHYEVVAFNYGDAVGFKAINKTTSQHTVEELTPAEIEALSKPLAAEMKAYLLTKKADCAPCIYTHPEGGRDLLSESIANVKNSLHDLAPRTSAQELQRVAEKTKAAFKPVTDIASKKWVDPIAKKGIKAINAFNNAVDNRLSDAAVAWDGKRDMSRHKHVAKKAVRFIAQSAQDLKSDIAGAFETRHDLQRERLKKKHAQQLENSSHAFDELVEKQNAQWDALTQHHERELKALTDKRDKVYTEAVATLTAAQNAETTELAAAQAAELAQVSASDPLIKLEKTRRQVDVVTATHRSATTSLNSQHANALTNLKTDILTETKKQVDELCKSQEAALVALYSAHSDEVTSFETSCFKIGIDDSSMKQTQQRELEALKQKQEDESTSKINRLQNPPSTLALLHQKQRLELNKHMDAGQNKLCAYENAVTMETQEKKIIREKNKASHVHKADYINSRRALLNNAATDNDPSNPHAPYKDKDQLDAYAKNIDREKNKLVSMSNLLDPKIKKIAEDIDNFNNITISLNFETVTIAEHHQKIANGQKKLDPLPNALTKLHQEQTELQDDLLKKRNELDISHENKSNTQQIQNQEKQSLAQKITALRAKSSSTDISEIHAREIELHALLDQQQFLDIAHKADNLVQEAKSLAEKQALIDTQIKTHFADPIQQPNEDPFIFQAREENVTFQKKVLNSEYQKHSDNLYSLTSEIDTTLSALEALRKKQNDAQIATSKKQDSDISHRVTQIGVDIDNSLGLHPNSLPHVQKRQMLALDKYYLKKELALNQEGWAIVALNRDLAFIIKKLDILVIKKIDDPSINTDRTKAEITRIKEDLQSKEASYNTAKTNLTDEKKLAIQNLQKNHKIQNDAMSDIKDSIETLQQKHQDAISHRTNEHSEKERKKQEEIDTLKKSPVPTTLSDAQRRERDILQAEQTQPIEKHMHAIEQTVISLKQLQEQLTQTHTLRANLPTALNDNKDKDARAIIVDYLDKEEKSLEKAINSLKENALAFIRNKTSEIHTCCQHTFPKQQRDLQTKHHQDEITAHVIPAPPSKNDLQTLQNHQEKTFEKEVIQARHIYERKMLDIALHAREKRIREDQRKIIALINIVDEELNASIVTLEKTINSETAEANVLLDNVKINEKNLKELKEMSNDISALQLNLLGKEANPDAALKAELDDINRDYVTQSQKLDDVVKAVEQKIAAFIPSSDKPELILGEIHALENEHLEAVQALGKLELLHQQKRLPIAYGITCAKTTCKQTQANHLKSNELKDNPSRDRIIEARNEQVGCLINDLEATAHSVADMTKEQFEEDTEKNINDLSKLLAEQTDEQTSLKNQHEEETKADHTFYEALTKISTNQLLKTSSTKETHRTQIKTIDEQLDDVNTRLATARANNGSTPAKLHALQMEQLNFIHEKQTLVNKQAIDLFKLELDYLNEKVKLFETRLSDLNKSPNTKGTIRRLYIAALKMQCKKFQIELANAQKNLSLANAEASELPGRQAVEKNLLHSNQHLTVPATAAASSNNVYLSTIFSLTLDGHKAFQSHPIQTSQYQQVIAHFLEADRMQQNNMSSLIATFIKKTHEYRNHTESNPTNDVLALIRQADTILKIEALYMHKGKVKTYDLIRVYTILCHNPAMKTDHVLQSKMRDFEKSILEQATPPTLKRACDAIYLAASKINTVTFVVDFMAKYPRTSTPLLRQNAGIQTNNQQQAANADDVNALFIAMEKDERSDAVGKSSQSTQKSKTKQLEPHAQAYQRITGEDKSTDNPIFKRAKTAVFIRNMGGVLTDQHKALQRIYVILCNHADRLALNGKPYAPLNAALEAIANKCLESTDNVLIPDVQQLIFTAVIKALEPKTLYDTKHVLHFLVGKVNPASPLLALLQPSKQDIADAFIAIGIKQKEVDSPPKEEQLAHLKAVYDTLLGGNNEHKKYDVICDAPNATFDDEDRQDIDQIIEYGISGITLEDYREAHKIIEAEAIEGVSGLGDQKQPVNEDAFLVLSAQTPMQRLINAIKEKDGLHDPDRFRIKI